MERMLPFRHSLLLCVVFGPLGLLSHMLTQVSLADADVLGHKVSVVCRSLTARDSLCCMSGSFPFFSHELQNSTVKTFEELEADV